MIIKVHRPLLVMTLLTLGWTINSFACSCSGKGTVSGNIKYADVAFSGQVISRTLTTNYDSLGVVTTGDTSKMYFKWWDNPIAVVRIVVDKIYKGQQVLDTLTILTPPNSAACGYYFQVGQKYIVYATTFDDMLGTARLKRRTFDNITFWTHQCTRTQNWNITEENDIIKQTK